MLTMAVLRNRLLLPGAGVTPKIIKGDVDALGLVKPTGSDPFRGANASTSRDGERPARRAPRLESPVKGDLYSQVGACHYAPTLGTRGPTSTTPWSPTVTPPGTKTPQAAVRNARLGSRQQQFDAAAGSAATPHQLRKRLNQHGEEQAAQMARPDALQGRHVFLTAVRRVGRATTRTRRARTVNGWGAPSESVPGASFQNKGMSSGGTGGAGSDARFSVEGGGSGPRARLAFDCLAVS